MKQAFKNSQKKNLILLKDLPSVVYDGVEYSRDAGTICQWNEKDQEWDLTDQDGVVDIPNFIKNKKWYGLTDEPATHITPYVGEKLVQFKKGYIEIGCHKINNAMVKHIASLLK